HIPTTHATHAKVRALLRFGDPAALLREFQEPQKSASRDYRGTTVVPVTGRTSNGTWTALLAGDPGMRPMEISSDHRGQYWEYRQHDIPVSVVRPPAAETVSADVLPNGIPLPGE
ncbi:MAG TPA: hypothetical protein VLH10_20435, partial [Yinghuangia sp.]|nr:hypothetical protein [Yinghuangia sp.]